MKIKCLSFEELPDWVDENSLSDNGCGKELATYLIVDFEDGSEKFVFSDAMESEDARFYRDLNWIKDLVKLAFEKGKCGKI